MYSSIRIADEFLRLAKESGCKDMSPMKLIKLVYLAHGISLAYSGEPLIYDAVEAWRYGPVIPTLYHQVMEYGSKPVKSINSAGNAEFRCAHLGCELDEWAIRCIEVAFESLGNRTAASLCALTHELGSPWDQTIKKNNGGVIPDHLTEEYYRKRYKVDNRD